MEHRKLFLVAAGVVAVTMPTCVMAQAQTLLSETGELTRSDPRDADGNPADTFQFTADRADAVRIESIGIDHFDTKVQVEDENGHVVGSADDINIRFNRDAVLNLRIPHSGTYRLTVSAGHGGHGGYHLNVTRRYWGSGPLAIEPAHYIGELPAPYELTTDQTDALNAMSPTANGLYYRDFYTTMSAGERRIFSADSDAFDSVLLVFDPADTDTPLASNDDSNGTLNSEIRFWAPHTGNYIVRVTQIERYDGQFRVQMRRDISK
jgi:hypothetical protein